MATKNLVKTIDSLCPRCLKKIPAGLVEEGGRIEIKKECPEHGKFEDVYWGDAENYHKIVKFQNDGRGVDNPRFKADKGCPYDCGLCSDHKSQTVLGIVDVTNRCNIDCPVCFANANVTGRVYEPSREQIREMLQNLRNNKPIPAFALQFSGGEPTVRDDLPELIKIAREVGFSYVMVDTNGINVAGDMKYLRKLKDAGMNSFYLQFDGLDDEIYERLRGRKLLNTKLRVIENCRKLGARCVILVVTLVKGVNDHQIGGIIEFALRNSDVISSVNFQPISFAGKASQMRIREGRITIPEFVERVEKQTKKKIKGEHFYPVPAMVPISAFIEAYKQKPIIRLSTHPCCGVGAYMIIGKDGVSFPINEVINVDKFLDILNRGSKELKKKGRFPKNIRELKIATELLGEIILNIHDKKLTTLIGRVLKNGNIKSAINFHQDTLMIGCMHFMDGWNFDCDRVQRCAIHYSLPDGRIVPFCSYNTIHRTALEKKFSVPLDEWKKSRLRF